jgi:hypothetical protein
MLDNEISLPVPMWPNGTFLKELSAAETLSELYKTQWAWKNNRSDPYDPVTGVKTTYYVCQGVWQCVNCPWTLRPMIRSADFEKQKGFLLFSTLTLTS